MSVTIYLVPDQDLNSNQPPDAEIVATAAALEAWITTDLGPAYGQGWQGHYPVVGLRRGERLPIPGERTWLLHLKASLPVAALGYHTRDVNGWPVLYVDVVAAALHNQPWSLVASHEIAETLCNRYVDGGVLASYGVGQGFYYQECCDPVEGQPAYFYPAKGVKYTMTNFVLPPYWVPGAKGPYDRNRYIRTPLTPAPGGVQTVFVVSGAAQIGADGATVADHPSDPMIHAGHRL
jgi:hypothetical protein